MGADVTMTDYLPEALDFGKQNWEMNLEGPANFKLLDWRNPDPSLATDILLASDIVYEKRSFGAVIRAFEVLVKPGGVILMSEPSRAYAKEFFEKLKSYGFSYT